ncbi:50S ribosomal protein L6 [Candidatus Parvarchaeota archaeon]|nr:MAG: 50S ribosomal protein L6 [Candidatus Parvarchaeota archaeon]
MRKKISFEIEIPEGVSCEYLDDVLECSKGEAKVNRKIFIPKTELKIEESKIILFCEKANRKNIAIMKTNLSHIKNIFKGLEEKFIYELEICNVHFPMNCKLEGKNLIIDNFLGEKIPRKAKILEDIDVSIQGNKITVSGNNIEKAGQTATNIEKATKFNNRDRRIFQDGIFITSKPGGPI